MTDEGHSLAGVKVRLEGAKSTSTTTDGRGYYAFTDLRAGLDYRITPDQARTNFTPSNRSFSNLTQDWSADFNGVSERDPKTLSESKPVSICTEADEYRERRNIISMYLAGWSRNIKGERGRIIAENVRDGDNAEATFGLFPPQISFFDQCKTAYVMVGYVWQIQIQIHTATAAKPTRVLNVQKQRRFVCKRMVGWFCTQI